MTLFVPKYFDIKLNFCCKEFKFKLNWYIWANTIDVVENFAVIKNVAIKSFHCIYINTRTNPFNNLLRHIILMMRVQEV